ncbi:MAG: hypothetical protein ACXACR_10895, partial [Candidatus Hodarchaeales archaeon]
MFRSNVPLFGTVIFPKLGVGYSLGASKNVDPDKRIDKISKMTNNLEFNIISVALEFIFFTY